MYILLIFEFTIQVKNIFSLIRRNKMENIKFMFYKRR